jgi:hypothetical protein
MATIPRTGPDLSIGGRIAAPAPDVNPGIIDVAGRALQNAGGALTEVGGDIRAEHDRRAHMDMLYAQQTRAAAIDAQSITALTTGRDQLADLHDTITQGVIDGSVPKDGAEAAYASKSRELLDNVDQNLPQEARNRVTAQLGGDAARFGNTVRRAVTQRDRMDVTSGIGQTLENLQRSFAADPEGATKQAVDTVDALGPHSTLTPEQQTKTKQAWKENTQYTTGYGLVTAGRNDRKQLDLAEGVITDGLPDLDPQKRAQLLREVETSRMHLDQKDEMAVARAQREWERLMKQAETSYNVMQGMADKGTLLDPQYTQQVMQLTAGTPYQAGVVALAKQAKDGAGWAAQPISSQLAALDQVNSQIATNGRTPELDARKNQLEKITNGSIADVKRDPMRAGLERGVITDLQPMDWSHGMPGVVAQIQQRLPGAQRVGMWAGQPVSPLTADEAEHLQGALSALAPKDRSTMIASIATSIGPQASQGLAAQMDPKDKALGLAFGYAGMQTTFGRYTSELVLAGQKAKADGTSTKGEKSPDLKVSGWQAYITDELGGAFPAETQNTQVRDAAVLIAHAIAAEKGGELSKDDMNRAVTLASGGPVVDLNGRKVPLPAGMDEGMLQRRLKGVSPQELSAQAPGGQVIAGGVPMSLADFTHSLPGQQLLYAGPGKYAVIVSGRPVKSTDGKNILIGVQ